LGQRAWSTLLGDPPPCRERRKKKEKSEKEKKRGGETLGFLRRKLPTSSRQKESKGASKDKQLPDRRYSKENAVRGESKTNSSAIGR